MRICRENPCFPVRADPTGQIQQEKRPTFAYYLLLTVYHAVGKVLEKGDRRTCSKGYQQEKPEVAGVDCVCTGGHQKEVPTWPDPAAEAGARADSPVGSQPQI